MDAMINQIDENFTKSLNQVLLKCEQENSIEPLVLMLTEQTTREEMQAKDTGVLGRAILIALEHRDLSPIYTLLKDKRITNNSIDAALFGIQKKAHLPKNLNTLIELEEYMKKELEEEQPAEHHPAH